MRINLLPKEERPLKQSQVRWEFLVGLIGILLLGAVLVFSWVENSKVQRLTLDYQEALGREVVLQKQVQAVNALKKDLLELETKEETYHDLLVRREQSLAMLPTLTKHPFGKLWLEAVVWGSTQVELRGYTQDMTSLSRYLNYLNEHSEQALLKVIHPVEGTDFLVFSVEVKGVASDATQLD